MATGDTFVHQDQSAKADGADATLVQPSWWNKQHKFGQLLTNKSGSQRVANDVVVADSDNDGAVELTTTVADTRPVFIVQATIADNAEGLHKAQGITTVAVQGAVTRGHTLRTSATSGKAESTGGATVIAGVFGVALTGAAGPGAGTVLAYLFGATAPGTVPVAASQAQQEAGSDLVTFTSPGRQHFHPSAAKFWVSFQPDGTVLASYNVTSVAKNGTGDWTITIATDFSSTNWTPGYAREGDTALRLNFLYVGAKTAGTLTLRSGDYPSGAANEQGYSVIHAWGYGDHA